MKCTQATVLASHNGIEPRNNIISREEGIVIARRLVYATSATPEIIAAATARAKQRSATAA